MQCNDIVMKAHQYRNMNYDEMHEFEMFNGAAQLARGIVLLLCKHNILFTGSYERNVSVQTIHISSWRRIASSHCWSEANWLSMPALMRRMVLYTLCLVACVIIDAGSSRSCAASDGSWRWISPSVAVLTGAEFPIAPPTARGGGM